LREALKNLRWTGSSVDTGTGAHTVEPQVRLNTNTSWQTGNAEAIAVIGKGSLTVEEVRLVKDADVIFP
jgi:hypothetical protein